MKRKRRRQMKTGLAIAAMAVAVSCAGTPAFAEDAKKEQAQAPKLKAQVTCPVAGGAIDKNLFVDNAGVRIYVCCAACLDEVRKDPAKYVKKLAEMGEAPAKLQTTCPVMKGSRINRSLYVDFNGKRIYVCCNHCVKQVKADPAKYVEQIEKEGIVLESVPPKEERKEEGKAPETPSPSR